MMDHNASHMFLFYGSIIPVKRTKLITYSMGHAACAEWLADQPRLPHPSTADYWFHFHITIFQWKLNTCSFMANSLTNFSPQSKKSITRLIDTNVTFFSWFASCLTFSLLSQYKHGVGRIWWSSKIGGCHHWHRPIAPCFNF